MVSAMTWPERLANYERETGFPRHLFIAGNNQVIGVMEMGNDYRVKSTYYGGYPAGYLRRIKALFPDKLRALHLFSGRIDTSVFPGDTVDINPLLEPTYCDNAELLSETPVENYDLILADPPYSAEDCEHYGCAMVNRNKVIKALAAKTLPGAHIVWLDQVKPMYRKDEWSVEAQIGMSKSTNHRFRMILVFGRV